MLLSPRELDRTHVLLDLPLERPEQLFDTVGRLAAVRGPRPEQVTQRLAGRHRRRAPPVVGRLALPHAAVPALGRPTALYLRSRMPLRWGEHEGVTDALALLVPLPGFAADRAWFDAVLQGLRRGTLLAELRAQSDAAAVHRLLTGVEQ